MDQKATEKVIFGRKSAVVNGGLQFYHEEVEKKENHPEGFSSSGDHPVLIL